VRQGATAVWAERRDWVPLPARPAAPTPTAVPPRAAAQPRLAPLEPDERTGNSKEDDLLDIPAFLRRQAN